MHFVEALEKMKRGYKVRRVDDVGYFRVNNFYSTDGEKSFHCFTYFRPLDKARLRGLDVLQDSDLFDDIWEIVE